MISSAEAELRERIMLRLAERVTRNGGVISRDELEAFDVDGRRVRLIDRNRGIRNPQDLDVTLSITSKPDGPYDDEEVEDGLLRYRYRKGSLAGDNRKLRAAVGSGAPLILLRWIAAGLYVPVFPVFAVADDPVNHSVMVALDESLRFITDAQHPTEDQRRYADRLARARLHQPEFRGRVIVAYDRRCAICELKHPELLDAAHIIPDSHHGGQPVVPNGLSLCKIHHAAYDKNLLGIDPDYRVHINDGLLHETDGPMLKHGIQEMDGRTLTIPRKRAERPDRQRLEIRFTEFLASA